MSLVYKNSVRENVTDIQTFIVDESAKSTKYFRVSDVPQVLQKGKNLLRITAHPTNLVPGTQVYVDVRDSNGNAIYYEIPDYLENDKSRVISIWIYHDKGDDNTPNGEATITLAGIANVDLNGNPLPSVHRNKINVKWQTTVTVDRERDNTSEIIFKGDILPIVAVSQSVEQYENQPQANGELVKTTQTGKVQYLFKGETPIVEIKDSSTLNGEMVGGDIILNNFTNPAEPINKIANPLSSTFFSSSIKEVLTNKVLKTTTNFTTSFSDRTDLTHTFDFVGEADYSIEYIQSGSNVSTQNKRNFANLSFSNVDPITGVVNKIKVLQKSDGLPGDFELVNEVDVPFSSSFDIKVPIPSKNLKDPKILKLLYLNSEGSISRTETISEPFVFDGDNIYIGGEENLISGSIFISNTLGTGIEIGGASSGFMRSVGYRGITSASLGKAPGGFVIYSGSGNLVFGEDTLDGVGMEFVGDNDARHLIFTTAGGGLLDVKTDKFFIGTESTQFISGSDGNIEISSSIFHLNPSANSGAGSLIIGANATILADLTVDNLRTPATIGGNASTETNSSSSIKADGFARFVSASIGGWDITTSSIEGGNLIMKPEGILQTRDFASGLKGWKISSEGNGTAEFENVRIRGTLRTTTFEKESVNAVGGQLWVANSTTITGSITATDTTMSVKNASGFSQGEILLIKKVDNTGFQTEYVLLESASVDGDNSNEDETHGKIMISRAYGSGTSGDFVGDLASAAQAYEDGQVIVSTGKLNTGYIKMNANPNDTATPFIDIVERTGSGLYDVALKARLGDLGGLANSSYVFGNSNPGFGLATENVFLQGGIIANTGSIGGIEMQDNKLFTGTGTHGNSNTGFYVDSGSQFSLGDKLVWNPSTEALTIRGSISLTDGTDVGDAIAAVSSPTGSRTVSMTADKYVITFDAAGNETPSNQTITLSATTQSFGTATAYYEFLKDGTLQGSRGTTSTFTVNTTLEKPTASTPKTYAVNVFTQSSGGTSVAADNLTLFGIQPGSDGAEGQDAVTAFLTNEAHTLPLSSSGAIQSYAGANTQMKVFEGITDKTSAYTFTESSPSHITATSSSNTFTIASTTTPHSGSVTITAASGSVSLSKIMSIGVTRQGDDGTDGTPGVNGDNAKTLIASVDSQVFAFDDSTDNSATPGSITFAFSQQNLNDTIQSSDITITTADSNSVTNFSFDSNSVGGPANQKSGIVSGSVSFTGGFSSGGLNGAKSSLPLTISCTNDSLTDSVTVFKVEGGADGAEGQDAVTAFLTNESHTLPSQNDGTVVSFVGAVTDMEVFEGTSNKNSAYTFSRTSSTSVSSSISDNTITITSMAHDSGSVIITATSASVSLSKTMTLSKSKQGTAGLPGAAAKLLTLTSDSQVFAFPSASSSTPEDNDILIIVNQQNLSGTIDAGDITIKDAGGNTLTDPTFVASVTDGTGQVSGSITFGGVGSTVGGDKTKLPLTIEVAKDSLEDSLKIFKIDGGNEGQDGADAVTAFLTNESHTFAADSTGAIAVFTGGATDMEVFEGITNKTSAYTISRSSTTAVSSSISGKTITVTSMAHDSGSIIVNASSGSVSINKTMSLTKARQGVDGGDGTSAKLLIGSLDSQVMAFDDSSDSTATPTSVEFSFQQQNLSGSAGYLTLQSSDITIALNGGGNITGFNFDNTDVSNGTGIASGSISFTGNTNAGGMGGDKNKFPVTIAATKDGLNDTIKIFKVEGGADGTDSVQVILSNESHTLAAQNDGTVISFTGADTDVTVFEGITDKTSAYTISRTNGTGVSTNLLGDGSTYSAGASSVNVDVTGMTHDSGSVTINAASGSVSIDKIMSLTKAKQGQDGDKFADTSITTTINLTTLSVDDTLTFTADTELAWTAGLTAVLSKDSSNFINGTVNSYNSANGVMELNVDTITGGGTHTAWSLNVGGVAGPQGLSGANAKNIVASVDSQVFSFLSASDNTAEPTSVIFSFNQQNLNNATIGSGDITITGADGTNITNFSLNNNDVDSNFSGIVSGSLSFSAATNSGGLNSDKDKLPVTISATKDGLTDSIKVFKVEGGTAGSDGTDAVTTFLTNEAHTFAAANNGNIVSFNGAFTDMEVFQGITNVTSNYVISSSNGTGVTATDSGKRVTITGLSHDSGSVLITATSASTQLTKTMSLVKSKQGAQGLAGDDAKMLTITSDSPVFSFASSSSSTAIDNTIELVINQQNLSATIDTNDLVIKDAGGNPLTNPTLAPSSLTNNTGLVSGSITFSGTVSGDKTKLPLEITITQDGLEDSLKIFKVEGGTSGEDGTDAINGFLSNESHTFPADSTGAIASFAGGTSTMSVFEGVTDVTANYSYARTNGTGVTSALGGTNGNVLTISALGHDSGSVDITATSGSASITKTMSLTKARQGSDGSDGTSAKLLIGSLSSPVFTFLSASDTSADPLSIEFSFQQQNLSGSGGFLTIGSSDIDVRDSDNTQLTGFAFDNNDVSNGTGIVSGSITFASANNAGGVAGDKTKLPITITATKDSLSDSVTIFKIEGGASGEDGTSAVTALLTNDSHTLPIAAGGGSVISYAGANTDIVVFQGTSDVTNAYTINTGSVSSHITTTTSGDTVTITNATTPYSGSVVITATSGSTVLSKTMTVSAAQQGSDGTPGTNAKTITISSDTQTFAFDDSTDSSATPTQAVFSINQQNLSGAIAGTDITITKQGGGTINTPTVSGGTTNGTGTRTFTLPFSSLAKTDLPLSVSVSKDSVTDSTTIIKVEGGANGVSALQYLLTNEAHIVPASATGVVSSYSNSGTEIYVYEGTTELDYDGSGTTAAHWKVGTPTVSPSGKITVGSITDGGNYAVVGNHSSMANDTDSVTISYPISGKTADGTAFSFTKTQTIAKSKEGADGAPGDDAKTLSVTADSQVFTFSSASNTTVPDDNTIEFFFSQQNLSGTIGSSDITVIDNNDNDITSNPSLSPSSLSGGSGVVSGSYVFATNLANDAGKFPCTVTVSKDGLTDSFKVFAISGGTDGTAGADAYTVFLTNESHTFPAAANGDVDSSALAAGATEVRVFKGTTQLTNDNNSPYDANSYRAVASTSGITLQSQKISNQRKFTPTAVANDTGTATITITDNADGTQFTKTYTFSKSKEGAQGAQGSDSKTVALTAATNVITYNAAGSSPSPSSTITLTADSQNFTDGYFKFTGDGISDEGSYTNGSSANQDTFTFSVPSSYFSTPKTIRVGVSEANQTELAFDTVTIVAVQPGADGAAGADAVTAFLTSEADVVPAAANGTVSSFAGSGTTMKVFEGITDKTSAYTYTLQNTTTGLTAALSTNVLTVSGLTPDSGSTDIRATSGSVTIDKTYSIGKSKAGPQGADNQDFSFLDANLSAVQGTLAAGLLMNSDVFGYHGAIGSGVTATLSDFTSFLDKDGNFYLGGNSSGATTSGGGYFAWNNTNKSLLISGSKAQVEVDKFFLGNVGTQFISGSNGNIKISGDVEFEGKNSNGATVFFDDFAGNLTANQTFVTSDSPQVDGSGVGYYMHNQGGTGERAFVTGQGEFSGRAAQIGNNSGNDEVWLTSNKLIPFNEQSLYEIEVRFKFTHGGGRIYAGVTAFNSDGTTKVNTAGNNDYSGQHYFAVSGQYKDDIGEDWVIYKGYFKGTASSGNGSQHNSDTDPGTIHSSALNGYIAPMFLSNFDNTPGRVYIDYIKLSETGGGGSSKISGDSITTGTIKSNNLSTTVGTSLGLNDGVMKIGGTGAYTSNNGILLDGPNAKFAVGSASGNYMRFNHTAGVLEVSTPNFSIDDSSSVVIQGDISVVQPDGTVVNLGVDPSEELFNVMIPPSAGTDDGAGRPVDFFSAYGTSATDTFTFTDLNDGNGNVLDIYKSGIQNLGVATKAIEPTSNKYKIRITLKGGATSSQTTITGLYLRIYETTSTLGANDKFVTLSSKANSTNSEPGYVAGGSTHWSDGAFGGASWYRVSGSAGNGQGEDGSRVNLSGTYWPSKYTTFETIYTPTNGTTAFSLNILNWSGNSTNHAYIKDIAIIPVRRASVITGDNIKTGKLESTNLSPGEGSVLDLNSGSMKMGGTANPGFEVTDEGFVTATNLVEKIVIVTDNNSGSYFETFNSASTNWTRLILDGSLGGDVTMNMTLESQPPYVISDLKFPANASIDTVAKLQLTILTQSVQFNEGAVSSGFASFGLSLSSKSFGGGIA